MADMVTIGGASVDINDPCAVLTELRKAQIRVAAGEVVSMARFGDDETRWSAANADRLDKLIAQYEARCDRASGKRRRFAAGIRFS